MAYLIRKNSRRATAGGRIEDNWVELPTPELAIATSAPAFPIFGGRLGAHFGRMGVALSGAVPHGISNANGLLHSQTIRRGSISEITNNWPGFLASERREPRTHSALALVNNVVSVFAFAPNPGSPPSSPASLHIQQSAPPKSSWLTVFSGENTTEPSRAEQEHGTDQRDPEPQQENAVEFPKSTVRPFDPLHQPRSMTCPVPSIHNRDSAYGIAQYITMGPQPLFDSPVPLTSGTNTRRDAETIDETADEYTAATSKDIIEGLGGLCSILDCQPGEDWHSARTSFVGPRPMTETQDFPTSIHQDSTSSYYTPMSNVFSCQQPTRASSCDRKLLIIGSSYACRTASNFAYQSGLGTLDATLYDTKSIKSVFRRRAYSIETLVGEDFNRDVLLQRVANFLRPAKRGDVRAIVLTGHGRRTVNGKVAIVPPICRGEEGLIPADLWDQTIRENTEAGVILLSIFATCMSGAFMQQRVNFNDLSNPLPSRATIPPDAPIFVTFASSQPDQSTYESAVEVSEDGTEVRPGDHFLRAFTLAAREPNVTDWQSFIDKLEEHFARMRQMGDFCAKQSGDLDMNEISSGSETSWSEHAPQQPEYSVSQLHLPLFGSVFPSEISLIERPTTPLDGPTNIAEEFLAHIAIRGDFPEITHYTMSSTRSDVVPPV